MCTICNEYTDLRILVDKTASRWHSVYTKVITSGDCTGSVTSELGAGLRSFQAFPILAFGNKPRLAEGLVFARLQVRGFKRQSSSSQAPVKLQSEHMSTALPWMIA